ncbi:hypothetical protein SDC9_78313 [bioreactor metagenome]|uniref:Uncharacterized protein n=1 Tax=bioreactor metagenome TaxID=1076179 RepID=A0A644YTC1_9ZZZZ
MRTRGGAERRFEMLAEEIEKLAFRRGERTANAEHAALLPLFQYPVHQLLKRDRRHTVGHAETSCYL